MKVKKLHLQNYGRFDNLEIEFAPNDNTQGNVTIIVGNNGAGKSQILQALATGFSWFVNGLKNKSDGFEIDKKFIKNGFNDICVNISTNFNNKKVDTDWQFMTVRDGRNSSFKNKMNKLNNIIDNYRTNLTKNNLLSLPLIIYYPVERSILDYSQDDILFDQLDAYFDCVNGVGIDFYNFFQWFKKIEDEYLQSNNDNLEELLSKNEVKPNRNVNKIKALIQQLHDMEKQLTLAEKSIESFKKTAKVLSKIDTDTDTDLEKEILEMEWLKHSMSQERKEIVDKRNSLERFIIPSFSNEVKFNVENAIQEFTDFKNIRIERQGTPKMVVEKDGEKLDVNQLSHGEKSLLALVGDIARRLAILNPSLDNPLQGEGVVLIDEVDLHLHPKWQQNLIDKLTKTFPNVQFILTTHSPHIVSDNPDVLVYILDNGELRLYNNAYGEDVNTLLNGVFGVSEFTPEIAEQFTEVRRAISHKELEKAENIIQKLSNKLSPNNSELLRLQLYLAKAKLIQHKAS